MTIADIDIATAIGERLADRLAAKVQEGRPTVILSLTIREARAVCAAITKAGAL